MVAFKNAINATFEATHKQLDLMILNNNKIIQKLSKMLLNPLLTEGNKPESVLTKKTYYDIEELIYSLKIKIELYKFIYSHIQFV